MKKEDRGSWAIGGCMMMGIGVGFVFLRISVFYFIASIMFGIGLGLLVAALISKEKE